MLNNPIIINDIKKLNLEDYIKVLEEFIGEFKYFEVSLYSFGNIKHPSISDLDLVIVYDDNLDKETIAKIVKKAKDFTISSKKKKYIFTHDILIYPKSLFNKIKFLHTFQNMKLLYGNSIDILTPSKEQQDILEKIHFLNFTYNALFWIRDIKLQNKIYLRQLLLALNSVKHSFIFLNKIFHTSTLLNWIDILEKVRQDFRLAEKIKLSELERIIFEYLQEFLENVVKDWFSFPNIDKFKHKKFLIIYRKKFFPIPALILLHGASYWKCCPEYRKFSYWKIHNLLYPIDNFSIKNEIYKHILKCQMNVAIKFEKLYKKFGIKPLVPLMCNYCEPNISKKRKISLAVNNFILKMQLRY